MTNILRRALRLVDAQQIDADNDTITVSAHETLDALADQIARCDSDLIKAQTDLADIEAAYETDKSQAVQHVADAITDRDRAHAAFLKRCSEKFSVDVPLPGHAKEKDDACG